MIYFIIALVLLGIFTATFGVVSQRKNSDSDIVTLSSGSCSDCNGYNESCEHDCLLEASVKEIEYYDDEELDAFQGRQSNDYTDKEAEQFSEILYTMRQDEVSGWSRSLILRGISLPDQLKDEVIMMIEND